MARPAGFEPATHGLAYQLRLSTPRRRRVCGLDYLFAISGAARIVSTEPSENRPPARCLATDCSWVFLPSEQRTEPSKHPGRPCPWYGASWHCLPWHEEYDQRFPRDCHRPGVRPAVKVSPIQCGPLCRFPFPTEAPVRTLAAHAQRPLLYPTELRAHTRPMIPQRSLPVVEVGHPGP